MNSMGHVPNGTREATANDHWLPDGHNAPIDCLHANAAAAFAVTVEHALVKGSVVSVITTMELLHWRRHSDQGRRQAATDAGEPAARI